MTLTIARGILIAVVALAAQGAPPQRDRVSIAETGRASIAGVVVADNETRAPIRRAALTLTRAGVDIPQMTVSDDSGRFAFEALPAGVYTLGIAKGGYVSASYGASNPGLPGSPIPIRDGQRFDTGPLAMTRGAALGGRLLNAKGRPVLYGMVEAVPVQTVNGQRRRRPVAGAPTSVATNAHGEYRIYGLAPGDYLVAAQTTLTIMNQESREVTAEELRWAQQQIRGGGVPAAGASAPDPPRGRPVGYASTYFPGTTDVTTATIVTVGRGEERANLDFQIQFVATAGVSGTVVGPNGQPAPKVTVARNLKQTNSVLPIPSTGSVSTGPDGSFVMTGVAPGDYVLTAYSATEWGNAEFSANGEDLANVAIRLQPGLTVSGRISLDGTTAPPDLSRVRLSLLSPGGVRPFSSVTQRPSVLPDGSFRIEGVMAGTYRLRVTLPAAASAWTPKSAVVDGRDVLDHAFEARADIAGLALMLTDRPTELAGTLVDTTGQPTPQYYVVVFAIDRQYWTPESRRVQSARASADGTFSIRGLPAGEYFLAAMTEVDPARLQDASFLEQVAAASLKVTLVEGEKRTQTLRVGG